MGTKEVISLSVAAIVLFIAAWLVVALYPSPSAVVAVASFDECARAGYAVMESYPRQCASPDGHTFFEENVPVADSPNASSGCVVAGCSGQLCVSAAEAQDSVTTCEFRPEYACYAHAVCESQANGTCGWTTTPELVGCIANPPDFHENELQPI